MRYHKLLGNLKSLLQFSLLVSVIVHVTLAFQVGLSRCGAKDPDSALLLSTVFLEEMGTMTRKSQQCTALFPDNDFLEKNPQGSFGANMLKPKNNEAVSIAGRETAQERIHRIRSGKLTEAEKNAFMKIALTYGRRRQQPTKAERQANTATCSAMDHELQHLDIMKSSRQDPSYRLSTKLLPTHDTPATKPSSISSVAPSSSSDEIVLQSLLSNLKSLAKRSDHRTSEASEANLKMFLSNKTVMLQCDELSQTKNHPIETTKQRISRNRKGTMTNDEKNKFLIAISTTSENRQINMSRRRLTPTQILPVCDGRSSEIIQKVDGRNHQSHGRQGTGTRQVSTNASNLNIDANLGSSKIATCAAVVDNGNFSRQVNKSINAVSGRVKSLQSIVFDSRSYQSRTQVQKKQKRFSHHWSNVFRPPPSPIQDLPGTLAKIICNSPKTRDPSQISSPEHMSSIQPRPSSFDEARTKQKTSGPIRMMLPFQDNEME